MTDNTKPEALDLADWLEAVGGGPRAKRCAALLREQHTRIAELESELEAVGAGGVQALSAAPEAIAKLRHLYQNMVNGAVRDTASAKRIAEGLLAPAIEALERATPPAEQAAPKAEPEVGNSGFDYKTAADFLNGKTVSDEAVRKFVAASRWAHDERAALSATLLAMHGVLTSREAEIALLKKALLEAEAAPKQEAQEPVAWLSPWRADRVTTDYDAYGERGIPLYTAPQQEPSRDAKTWCSYVAGMIGCYLKKPDESAEVRAIAGIIERRLWALPAPQQESQEPAAWESTILGYIKYITQAQYEKFRPNVRRWYKPYKCSSCAAPQPAPDCHHRPPCDECAALAAQGGKV